MASRPGRRPGPSDTRAAVLRAARERFATVGFAATTIRSVAADAGVDPSLVMQYHGSKRGLFLDALALPFEAGPVVEALADGPRSKVGERLMAWVVAAFADPQTRSILLARIRAAATEPEGAALVRQQIAGDIVVPLARRLGVDRPELRAALVSSQMIGFAVARWVVEIEALADLDLPEAAPYIAPVFQRYLVGPLPR